ncbi:MAG: sensor domain-containing diguanylate cyclase [Miltoncostaeaceae bacterium]
MGLDALARHAVGVMRAAGAEMAALVRFDGDALVDVERGQGAPVCGDESRSRECMDVIEAVRAGAPAARSGHAVARRVLRDGSPWGAVAGAVPAGRPAALGALEAVQTELAGLVEAHLQVEHARNVAERRSHMILDSIADGVYGVDLDGRATFINPAGAAMLGRGRERFIGRHTHPLVHHSHADGTPYPASECMMMAAVRAGVESYREDEVFWRPDGTCFPVAYTTTPLRDGAALVGAVVTFRDITERRRTDRRLRASEERFRTLTRHAPVGIFQADVHGGFTFVSERWCAITGRPAELALGDGWLDAVHPDDVDEVASAWRAAVADERPLAAEHRYRGEEDPPVWVLFDAVPLRGDEGGLTGFIGTITDISSRRDAERQARTDVLTGLANRRAFIEALGAEIGRATRLEEPLALVMLDLDRFKDVNDTHGHVVGDRVLTETADRLRGVAREHDTLARIGGEEFAWLLPDTGPDGALAAAERARLAVRGEPYEVAGLLTISAGVAAGMGEALAGEELMARADEALYRAKRGGRDAVAG